MSQSRPLLDQAKEILASLKEEKICSTPSNNNGFVKKLNFIRALAVQEAQKHSFIAPGMTANVATTFLGVGLCQELSQRFVLEYCIKFKVQNIHLLFLGSEDFIKNKDNHVLVLLGPIKVADELILGRGNSDLTLVQSKHTFDTFLQANLNGVLADPLLEFAGTIKDGTQVLQAYCKQHSLTHLTGVRSYTHTPSLVENASIIKANATKLSAAMKPSVARFNTSLLAPLADAKMLSEAKGLNENEFQFFSVPKKNIDYVKTLQYLVGPKLIRISKNTPEKNPPMKAWFSKSWLKTLPADKLDELAYGAEDKEGGFREGVGISRNLLRSITNK